MPDAVTITPLALLGGLLPTIVVILGIGFLIFVHELGHFLVAKWCKVRVEAFSLGFGPVIFGFRRGDTHYRLSAIPLGGYVKMAGETPTDESSDDPAEFQNKNRLQRAAILIAGVVMNAITAFLLFVVAFNVGVPLASPDVGSVVPGSPAWEAGIEAGDRIVRIDDTNIVDFDDVMQEVAFSKGAIDITVRRDGEEITFENITPRVDQNLKVPMRMIGVGMRRILAIDPGSEAAKTGLENGDELVTVFGIPASDLNAVRTVLSMPPPELPIAVLRGGEIVSLVIPTSLEPAEDARPLIGITQMFNRVAAVREGSKAAQLGFKAGDLLVAVGASRVTDFTQARELAVAGSGPVEFKVERKGEVITLPPCQASDYTAFFSGIAPGAVSMDEARIRLMPDAQFQDGNPAATAGVKDGARILTVNGRPVKSFSEIHEQIGDTDEGQPVRVTWTLAGEENPEAVIVRRGMLGWNSGIALAPVTENVRISGIIPSCREGVRRSILNARRILQTLGGLVTGRISPKALGGPIKIFEISYVTADRNFIHFLYFLGILSINLAILNILPIPLLDGGHLLFILIETIKGKPLSEKTMAGFQWAGLLFLLLLLVFVMTNDISSYF